MHKGKEKKRIKTCTSSGKKEIDGQIRNDGKN